MSSFQHLNLGNISTNSLQEEQAPFPLFLQVAATLLDEYSNLASSTSAASLSCPTYPFHYDVRKPLAELERELLQYIAYLMDTPVESIRLDSTRTRLEVLRFLATELEACKLSIWRRRVDEQLKNVSSSPNTLSDILGTTNNDGSSQSMTRYLDQLSVLLKTGWIQSANEAKSLIRLANERIHNSNLVHETNLTKYIQEYISDPNHQRKIQEIHHNIYIDYKNRSKLLTSRLQATLECFQSSERWTTTNGQRIYQLEHLRQRMFSIFDLYYMTREDLELV